MHGVVALLPITKLILPRRHQKGDCHLEDAKRPPFNEKCHEKRPGECKILEEVCLLSHFLHGICIGPEVMNTKGRGDKKDNKQGDRKRSIGPKKHAKPAEENKDSPNNRAKSWAREPTRCGIPRKHLRIGKVVDRVIDEVASHNDASQKKKYIHSLL